MAIACHSRSLHEGEVSADCAYTSVHSCIDNITEADPPVVKLALLGAHDANTYALQGNNGFSGEVRNSTRLLHNMVPGLAYRYTKTQASTIYEQLCQGVRFLHIKCSYFNNRWYGSHALLDGPIDIYIQDVIRFLQANNGEIVVIELQLMYGEGTDYSQMMDQIFSVRYNGQTLDDVIPYENVPLPSLTYNTVTQQGTKGGAVVVAVGTNTDFDKQFFDVKTSKYVGKCYCGPNTLYSPWINRMDTDAIAAKLDEQCATVEQRADVLDGAFRVMQVNTTPNFDDPWQTISCWSLLSKAKDHNYKMITHPHIDNWLQHMPIFMCDFATSANNDFNRLVNDKLLAYNRALVSDMLVSKKN